MQSQNDRVPFDWSNYFSAVVSGGFIAAIASAVICVLIGSIMAPIPLPDAGLVGILKFLFMKIFAVIFGFGLFFFPSLVIASVATFVFGSMVLVLVRGGRFQSVSTFAVSGFIFGYFILIAFGHLSVAPSARDFMFATIGGLAGLAGGWGFGHRICHPGFTYGDETYFSRMARFLLGR